MPAAAFGTEIGKHVYPYVGVNLSSTGIPPPPKWLYLNAYHSVVTAGHRTSSADEFENTFTFRFTIGNDGAYWNMDTCARDSESKDGLGLPGSHGCGYYHRVPGSSRLYLG